MKMDKFIFLFEICPGIFKIKINQSLAGRTAILKLLPLSISDTGEKDHIDKIIFRGMYPRIIKDNITPQDFYSGYVQKYIERDVRLIKNIHDIGVFHLFVKMCAGRTGQILNFSSLSNECGISQTTAKSWLSILEQSFIVFLLRPYYRNFNKRLVKTPKLYFFDTGLASYLLNIQSGNQLKTHYAKGALFESFIISEIKKSLYNNGREPKCYFWRDKTGNGIDLIIEKTDSLLSIEIKSGQTVTNDWYKNLNYFSSISKGVSKENLIIYGEDNDQLRSSGKIISWKNMTAVFN